MPFPFGKSHKSPADIVKNLKESIAVLEKQDISDKKAEKAFSSNSFIILHVTWLHGTEQTGGGRYVLQIGQFTGSAVLALALMSIAPRQRWRHCPLLQTNRTSTANEGCGCPNVQFVRSDVSAGWAQGSAAAECKIGTAALLRHDSIATGSVPQDWRIANVVPIFKKGSKSEPGNYRPATEEVSKNLVAMKEILYGTNEKEPQTEAVAQLAQELYNSGLLGTLVADLQLIDFEGKKDVAQIFNNILRRQIGTRTPTVEYICTQQNILFMLLKGYESPEIALNCGIMLRECIRHEPLAKIILWSEQFYDFFRYVEMSTFDIASDAFATFKVRSEQ
ncbi:unnamed protein product [Ranitomeya imitator]|uniref:Uncharacterized protein n=1 Tax=Ranitomeya imitator TaxID=111125 RepID=A0ABN9MQL3_9NEOB|nr:unnamed protein product [Ranitomeya imitator]